MRRLPIYLLLDCSESMAGPYLEAVQHGVDAMLAMLRCDPISIESAWISVITFAHGAAQPVPLTPIADARTPLLRPQPGTSLGAALTLLDARLGEETVQATAATRGDYRPIAFLVTDGQPTDEWEAPAQRLRARTHPRLLDLVAVGCGDEVDFRMLYRLTDVVASMPDLEGDAFKNLFRWVSQSVGSKLARISLPTLPDGLQLAPTLSAPARQQVFLHATCSRRGRPYVMRFRPAPDGAYDAAAAHPLDVTHDGGALPAIAAARLRGVPACPHCSNPSAMRCECGLLMCWSPDLPHVQCPGCACRISRDHVIIDPDMIVCPTQG